MKSIIPKKSFLYLISWTLTYIAAVVLGIMIASFILNRTYPGVPVNPLSRILVPLLSGFFLGLTHCLHLRNFVSRAGWLVILLPISWSLAWIIAGLFNLFIYPADPGNIKITLFLFTFIGLIEGSFLGVAVLVILRKTFSMGWLYIILSCFGWAAGMPLGGAALAVRYEWIDFWVVQSFIEFDPYLYGVASLMAGLSTGLCMIYLINRMVQDNQAMSPASSN